MIDCTEWPKKASHYQIISYCVKLY